MKKWWSKQIPNFSRSELIMFAAIGVFVFMMGLLIIVRQDRPTQEEDIEYINKQFPVNEETPSYGR